VLVDKRDMNLEEVLEPTLVDHRIQAELIRTEVIETGMGVGEVDTWREIEDQQQLEVELEKVIGDVLMKAADI